MAEKNISEWVGRFLKTSRESRGVSQIHVAKQLEGICTQGTLSRLEDGKGMITVDILGHLLSAYELTEEERMEVLHFILHSIQPDPKMFLAELCF